MVSLVNFHSNATSNRWYLLEIDLRHALNSTPGRVGFTVAMTAAAARTDSKSIKSYPKNPKS